MNIKIKEGDIIKIKNEKFEVLKVYEDIDWYDSKKNKFIGEHLAIELHKLGDSSLFPTHLLKIYHDKNKKAVLLRIQQDKHQNG